MAEVKFTVIREQPVDLSAAQYRRWERLKRRKEAYDRLGQDLDHALNLFLEDVDAALPKELSTLYAYKGLQLDEQGVTASICPCPTCQAELYGLPVETVARYMTRQGSKRQKDWAVQMLEHVAGKGYH